MSPLSQSLGSLGQDHAVGSNLPVAAEHVIGIRGDGGVGRGPGITLERLGRDAHPEIALAVQALIPRRDDAVRNPPRLRGRSSALLHSRRRLANARRKQRLERVGGLVVSAYTDGVDTSCLGSSSSSAIIPSRLASIGHHGVGLLRRTRLCPNEEPVRVQGAAENVELALQIYVATVRAAIVELDGSCRPPESDAAVPAIATVASGLRLESTGCNAASPAATATEHAGSRPGRPGGTAPSPHNRNTPGCLRRRTPQTSAG